MPVPLDVANVPRYGLVYTLALGEFIDLRLLFFFLISFLPFFHFSPSFLLPHQVNRDIFLRMDVPMGCHGSQRHTLLPAQGRLFAHMETTQGRGNHALLCRTDRQHCSL